MSLKGLGIGPRFTSLTFESNHVQQSGAVYVTASGNDVAENPMGGVLKNPTTFDRCKFIKHAAAMTGGAIDTVSGLDVISNTNFEGNTAGTEGALRLGGTASLEICIFIDISSGNGVGPAISNVGSVPSVAACTFVDNVFNCVPGQFLDYSTSDHVREHRPCSPPSRTCRVVLVIRHTEQKT